MKNIFAFIIILSFFITSVVKSENNSSHAIAMHGKPKYSENFSHLDYVNPIAPKGGKIIFSSTGSFDSFNPFILKGNVVAGINNLYDTLTASSSDEAFTEYGLIADKIEWPNDRSWVSYKIRKEALWHDGKKITPEDVIWTFNTLMEKGHPFYRYYYSDVIEVIKVNEDIVRFNFKDANNLELPLIVGQLPVLPKHYWYGKNFEETSMEIPIGSGPYKIKNFDPGRSITYELNSTYWGRNIPIKKGTENFEFIRYEYYKDRSVEREAFKSGDIDFFSENTSKDWATNYDTPAVKKGLIKKELIDHENPQGMQAFVFNIRKDIFKDKRVRKALTYAFDFEWTNKNLFYDAYKRTNSYFENSELASSGLPQEKELEFLNPYMDVLPKEIFINEYNPPKTNGSGFIREELQKATSLLQSSGWKLVNGELKNERLNKKFEFEILLVSPAFERIVLPFKNNLKKLGINVSVRTIDSAQYQNRINNFDFDMIVSTFSQSLSPGNEQKGFWGSDAADTNGSRNLVGIKSTIIDMLIEKIIVSKEREELINATKALDRVLLWNHYVIPQWHISSYRTLYWDIFDKPLTRPKYSLGTNTWWIDSKKYQTIKQRRKSL